MVNGQRVLDAETFAWTDTTITLRCRHCGLLYGYGAKPEDMLPDGTWIGNVPEKCGGCGRYKVIADATREEVLDTVQLMAQYALDSDLGGQPLMPYLNIEKLFTYHPPKDEGQSERFQDIRDAGFAFATVIQSLTPESAEQTLAIRAAQEAVMWANAAIAINES